MTTTVPIKPCPPHRIDEVREMFREYERGVGVDLCFQRFDSEVEDLPGEYAPPDGRLLVAVHEDRLVGCVALRRLSRVHCEMKRLFVRPKHTGCGLGRRLTRAIIDTARDVGYSRMRLDTLPDMAPAISLYRSLGFVEIAPYYPNPVCGAFYMELDLCSPRTGIDIADAQSSR